jgi:hypothetical protein
MYKIELFGHIKGYCSPSPIDEEGSSNISPDEILVLRPMQAEENKTTVTGCYIRPVV